MSSAKNQSIDSNSSSIGKSTYLFMLLIYLVGLGPTSFQIFLPSVPSLASDFGVSPAVANLTVSLSMISFAVGALVYGTLSQRIDSRSLLLTGMAILMCGSLLCMFAPNIELVIAGRIIQPLGGASGVVIARLIAANHFEDKHAADLMSKLAASMMIAPLLGVPLGGYLTEYFGWRSVFVFILAAASIALVLVALILERSHSEKLAKQLQKQNLLRDYLILMRNGVFVFNSGHFSFSQAALMCFLSASPLVLTTLFQMGPTDISLILILVAIGAVTGNMIAPRLPESISVNQRLFVGSMIACASGIVAILLSSIGIASVASLVIPVMVFSFCNGVASPVSQMNAIQANGQLSGTASGFSLFLSMFVASIATQVVSSYNNGHEWVVSVPLLIFTTLAFASILAATQMKTAETA